MMSLMKMLCKLRTESTTICGTGQGPPFVEMERKIQRRPVKLVIATEIESMVASMIKEEEDCD